MSITIHNLGYPRIGQNRELKQAQESYWNGRTAFSELEESVQLLIKQNTAVQKNMDFIPSGDFSYYDHILDTSTLFRNIPERFKQLDTGNKQQYFAMARGIQTNSGESIAAQSMTKWFDTNYHYLVPEFSASTTFSLNDEEYLAKLETAVQAAAQTQDISIKEARKKIKPVLTGPLSYLYLGRFSDGLELEDFVAPLISEYEKLAAKLKQLGHEWVQIDEPVLAYENLNSDFLAFYTDVYALLSARINVLLTSYFELPSVSVDFLNKLPVQGIHIDVSADIKQVEAYIQSIDSRKVLSLGIISGRNVWRSDIAEIVATIRPLTNRRDNIWLAPGCSLIHVPVSVKGETALVPAIQEWLAFADEKLDELYIIKQALEGKDIKDTIWKNTLAIQRRNDSGLRSIPGIKERVEKHVTIKRTSFGDRIQLQQKSLNLPDFPTTTIGSFPQSKEIRQLRSRYKKALIGRKEYEAGMKANIANAIKQQEEYGLDVLVHGEAERNDMVEYFGELLNGIVTTANGWVQSYGSRCVKPPIIYGDVERKQDLSVFWTSYAQSLTDKPVKGMLTGPITILKWSFIRDDIPRKDIAFQIALAIQDEVLELEKAGIKIIQIDEAAFREAAPIKSSQQQEYYDWAAESFRISHQGVQDATQIHTHMCYSDFNNILPSLENMDADVITIETSRSHMRLLEAFADFGYSKQIGPGVYDIHSPRIPGVEEMVELIKKAEQYIPTSRLWINPDCGLKTRKWNEVRPALKNMTAAARQLREAQVTNR